MTGTGKDHLCHLFMSWW